MVGSPVPDLAGVALYFFYHRVSVSGGKRPQARHRRHGVYSRALCLKPGLAVEALPKFLYSELSPCLHIHLY
jgi:hypothetical protein